MIKLITDAEQLRQRFERLANDSYGFKRSRKGNYVNSAVARDWKWFQAGHRDATSNVGLPTTATAPKVQP